MKTTPRLILLSMLVGLCLVATQTALAGTDPRDTKNLGELLVAKYATVDDAPATSGLTLISGSRVKTQIDGRAIINLGKTGRVTLGPEADVFINFTDTGVTGELISGWMTISSPKGVNVSFKTLDGVVVADGDQATVLKIDVAGGLTKVEAEGGARLNAGEKTEFVAAGEEVAVSQEDGTPSFARNMLFIPAARPESEGFGSIVAASVRGAIESVTLNRTLMAPPEKSLKGSIDQGSFGADTRITTRSELVSCGLFNENCADCGLRSGGIVKAKAGCTLGFTVGFNNVQADSFITVRPFFSSACFRIQPGAPQVVHIPPGGAAPFTIDARNCPRNAYQIAANSLIVIQSDTCGTQYVQVEWATPCR